MSNVKEKADKLIEEFIPISATWVKDSEIECAILSTENTIKVLEEIINNDFFGEYQQTIKLYLTEQNELLEELKNRL